MLNAGVDLLFYLGLYKHAVIIENAINRTLWEDRILTPGIYIFLNIPLYTIIAKNELKYTFPCPYLVKITKSVLDLPYQESILKKNFKLGYRVYFVFTNSFLFIQLYNYI